MSDDVSLGSATAGSLSPRNTDTIAYRVLKDLPRPLYAVGATFTAWPQGILWANVSTHGLGVITNGEIASWVESGLIVRETPLTPAQERARNADMRAAATPAAEIALPPSDARPWAFPEGSPDPSEPVN